MRNSIYEHRVRVPTESQVLYVILKTILNVSRRLMRKDMSIFLGIWNKIFAYSTHGRRLTSLLRWLPSEESRGEIDELFTSTHICTTVSTDPTRTRESFKPPVFAGNGTNVTRKSCHMAGCFTKSGYSATRNEDRRGLHAAADEFFSCNRLLGLEGKVIVYRYLVG